MNGPLRNRLSNEGRAIRKTIKQKKINKKGKQKQKASIQFNHVIIINIIAVILQNSNSILNIKLKTII